MSCLLRSLLTSARTSFLKSLPPLCCIYSTFYPISLSFYSKVGSIANSNGLEPNILTIPNGHLPSSFLLSNQLDFYHAAIINLTLNAGGTPLTGDSPFSNNLAYVPSSHHRHHPSGLRTHKKWASYFSVLYICKNNIPCIEAWAQQIGPSGKEGIIRYLPVTQSHYSKVIVSSRFGYRFMLASCSHSGASQNLNPSLRRPRPRTYELPGIPKGEKLQ